MIIQLEQKLGESKKAVKYCFLHPKTLRRSFAWFPKQFIQKKKFNQLEVAEWLWYKINEKL